MSWFLIGSLALVVIALLLRRQAKTSAAALDLQGEVIYWDGETSDDVFTSDRHLLVGKPDYILRSGGELIPVERKSRQLSVSGAYEGEILQLAAYCLLVEERFKTPVQRGQLQYQNRSLDISFDDELRGRLFSALRAIQEAGTRNDVRRSHNSSARCRACGFRHACTDSLA